MPTAQQRRSVWTKAKISSEDGAITMEVEVLVDTAATLTVIPRNVANALNLRFSGGSSVITGGGRVELDRSRAWVEILGRRDLVPVLISDSINKVLIGVTTLEILGLQVDPVAGELREWTWLLYRF